MADLKAVYATADETAALSALDDFEEIWGKKYPRIGASWRENWANLSTYFKFPDAVRRLIYTTNAIEGFNRQLRKVTKSKSVFPTDDSLLKMLYLAMMDITKKWTGRRMDWSMIHAQLMIFYGDRMPEQHKILRPSRGNVLFVSPILLSARPPTEPSFSPSIRMQTQFKKVLCRYIVSRIKGKSTLNISHIAGQSDKTHRCFPTAPQVPVNA